MLFLFYSICCIVRRCWTLAEWRLGKCRWCVIWCDVMSPNNRWLWLAELQAVDRASNPWECWDRVCPSRRCYQDVSSTLEACCRAPRWSPSDPSAQRARTTQCSPKLAQHCRFFNVEQITDVVLESDSVQQWCGLRLMDKTDLRPKKIGLGLGLAGLVLCSETRSCHARRHNDLKGHNNFSSKDK